MQPETEIATPASTSSVRTRRMNTSFPEPIARLYRVPGIEV